MNIIKRTKQQRQNEIKPIIKKLNELHLNTSYDGIKILFKNMKQYIDNSDSDSDNNNSTNNNSIDEPIHINIPCPELNILIKGILEIDLRKNVWVKLERLERPEE
jgi:hypothetical protein